MSFWGTLGSLAWKAVKAVGGYVADKVLGLFGSSEETSRRVGESDSYDRETASSAQTIQIQHALSEFKNEAAHQASQLEDEMITQLEDYFDRLLDEIEKLDTQKITSFPLTIPTQSIKRDNRKLIRSIRGKLKAALLPRVSLDDKECEQILRLESGEEKKGKMLHFINATLKNAVQDLQRDIKDGVADCVENTKEKLEGSLSFVQNACQKSLDELERLKQSEGKEASEKEQIQLKLLENITMRQHARHALEALRA